MQITSNLFKEKKYYLILLLVTITAYWPISFQIYSLKNDALVYFLPYRYHISESIQQGCFPWWNPYLYTGLPLHSDIQSGTWNPVVMFISLFTTYDMGVLQLEILFYLFIGAVGMYKLVRGQQCTQTGSLIAAVSFTCCGFMTDSGSLVPWITSAAWLPFVFLYFGRLLNNPTTMTAIKLALAMWLLLVAGYPSFFIFSFYIMLVAWIIRVLQLRKLGGLRPLFIATGISSLIFLILSSPALLSWWEFLSYYQRGSGTGPGLFSSNAFPIFSSISYLLPSAVSRPHEWLATDLTARNASAGIFMFLFFVLSLLKPSNGLKPFLLGIIIFSFLFSLGPQTALQEWCYRVLPGMDSFRHPASMRIFTTIAIILLASPVLDNFLLINLRPGKRFFSVIALIAVMIITLILIYYPSGNIMSKAAAGMGKEFLDKLSFADVVVIQGIIQLFFLLLFAIMAWRNRKKFIPLLIITNLVLFCWMALPFTFISRVKTNTINKYIQAHPAGFPMPGANDPVQAAVYSDSTKVSLFGYENFYNKTIRVQDHLVSPTIPDTYIEFLSDHGLRNELRNGSLAYFSDSAAGTVRVTGLKCNAFTFETTTTKQAKLVIFQQYSHNWTANVDKIEVPVDREYKAFTSINVPAGSHSVTLSYQPSGHIVTAVLLSLIALAGLIIYFIFHAYKLMRRND